MLLSISNAVLSGNMGQSMIELDKVLSGGKSPLVLSKDLISYFRDLMIIQTLGERAKTMVVASPETFEKMKQQATEEAYAKIVALITNLSEIEAELRYSINPRIVLETAIIKTLADVNLLERVEKLEKIVYGGAFTTLPAKNAENRPVITGNVEINQEKVQKTVENAPKSLQNSENANNLLGQLLAFLRENKDMGLLTAIRQVQNVDLNGKEATFYVDDKLTLELISREKNKLVLREFFDNLGISYQFKVKEQKSTGNVNELSSYFGGKLEVDE